MLEAQREARLEADIRSLATLEDTMRQSRRRRRRSSGINGQNLNAGVAEIKIGAAARHLHINTTQSSLGACRSADGSQLRCNPHASSTPTPSSTTTTAFVYTNTSRSSDPPSKEDEKEHHGHSEHGEHSKHEEHGEHGEHEEHEELPKFETLAPFAFSR